MRERVAERRGRERAEREPVLARREHERVAPGAAAGARVREEGRRRRDDARANALDVESAGDDRAGDESAGDESAGDAIITMAPLTQSGGCLDLA